MRFLKTPDDIVRQYVKDSGISDKLLILLDWPTNVVVPFLSNVKTRFHLEADRLSVDWKNYIDLASLAGYPDAEDRAMTDDPNLWLSTPVSSEYKAGWWCQQFVETFGAAVRKAPATKTLGEFALCRWLWVTGGSSSSSRAILNGEKVKTKFGAAISIPDADLMDMVFRPDTKIGVFIKPDEVGYKRRLIANISLGGYVIAAYIRHLLEGVVGSNPAFSKLNVGISDRIDVVGLIRLGRVMMPLDESAYDYHVSRESWIGFISFLKETFPDNQGVSLFEQFFYSAEWAFEHRNGRWYSGMPSGLALTSFVNSWMNYIKQKTIVPGDLQWAAGDDVLVAPWIEQSLGSVSAAYERFGSSVNATKNWTSHRYAEYLKVLYHDRGHTGYPARLFSSLVWAHKITTFQPNEKLFELAELWKQYFDRLGVSMDTRRVGRDLASSISTRVSGFNSVVAQEWLHSPRAYGGFGRYPLNDYVFDWKSDILERREYKNVIVRVPPVFYFSREVTLVRSRKPIKAVTFRFGKPVSLPPVNSMQEWEARLNREDLPVKGKYASSCADIIPLPCIDRVSTGVVAEFARQMDFNVYPNIVGSSANIPSRLVNGATALRNFILLYMSENGLTEMCG